MFTTNLQSQRLEANLPFRRRVGSEGLSLVEVMISVALLSVVLVALIGKVHNCIDTSHETEFQSASREFAKGMMGDIEAGVIDGLFNGSSGNFADRGYPQIQYMVGFGESSSVSATSTGDPIRKMYEKPRDPNAVYDPTTDPANDPNSTDPTVSEEPYMRVRVVVTYPTSDPDRTGSFTLERMVPTECTQGTSGIQRKRDKEEQSEKANAGNANANAKQNNNNNQNKRPGGGSAAAGSSSMVGGKK